MPRKAGNRKKPTKKNMPEVEELLELLPDKFLQCRSYNKHNLKPVTIFYWGPKGSNNYCRVSECSSCGARKEEYYYSDHTKMDTRMDYPDGYLVTGYGKIPTEMVMQILMGRHEIVNPEDLPPRVTKRLSNKGLTAVNAGKSDAAEYADGSDSKVGTKRDRRKNPKKDVAKPERVR